MRLGAEVVDLVGLGGAVVVVCFVFVVEKGERGEGEVSKEKKKRVARYEN